MTLFRTTVAAFLLTTAAAGAQSVPPVNPAAPTLVPAAPAAAAPAAKPELTKDGKPRMKDVRDQCREQVKAGGTRGDARHQAMADCIVKQRPDMEAKVKCQMDPSMKGLDKDARKAAVKACIDKSKT